MQDKGQWMRNHDDRISAFCRRGWYAPGQQRKMTHVPFTSHTYALRALYKAQLSAGAVLPCVPIPRLARAILICGRPLDWGRTVDSWTAPPFRFWYMCGFHINSLSLFMFPFAAILGARKQIKLAMGPPLKCDQHERRMFFRSYFFSGCGIIGCKIWVGGVKIKVAFNKILYWKN